MADEDFIYACVHAGMVGILITPLIILWSISLCLARRRKDPARTGLTWLKIVYPAEIIALILITTGDAIYAAVLDYTDGYSRRYSRGWVSSMANAQYRIGTVGILFERVANVLLIITFVELSNGFMYILDHKRTALQTTLRYVSFVAAVVLTALNVATTARFNIIYGQYLNSSRYTDYNRQIRDARKISGAYDVLTFIVSIGLLVYASVVMHRFRNIMFTKNSAVVLLVAAVLNFIRWLYALIIAAMFTLETNPTVPAPEYLNIIDAVLNTWIFFVVLVLLFVIGVWKHKGLWSTAQPFMSGPAAAPPMVYAIPQQQYGYGGPQQMPYQPQGYLQPQGWQGQPVQQPQQAYTGHTSVSPVDQHGTLPPQQQVPTPGPEGQANGFYPPREMKA